MTFSETNQTNLPAERIFKLGTCEEIEPGKLTFDVGLHERKSEQVVYVRTYIRSVNETINRRHFKMKSDD